MGTPPKLKAWCAVAIACLFFLQSCATITRGTSQGIPVTSNPLGARIIVDEKDLGSTPLILKLSTKKDHLIRIEKEGYVPLEIRVISRGASGQALFILGDILLGCFAAIPGELMLLGGFFGSIFNPEEGESTMESGALLMLLGVVAGSVGLIAIDSSSGGTRSLQPDVLNVTLKNMEEVNRSVVEVITLRDWQRIKWVRIRCSD